MAEPTGRLTFGDLLLEAALEMGVASFGSDGTEVAQVPTDTHDLAEVKRHVNNAIRMFFINAPAGDWRWRRPILSVDLWATVEEDSSARTLSGGAYDSGDDETTLTADTDVFYESMEGKDIVIDGVGTFEMKTYTSATVMVVTGDASSASSDAYSITADGNYTLPQSFGGQYLGQITYAADTNLGTRISWSDEGTIRHRREISLQTGEPLLAAVRVRDGSRRWELMVDPVASTDRVVEFPYLVYFTQLTSESDLPPIPYTFDEALRAATLAVIERDVHKAPSHHFDYYTNVALPSAWSLDARSGPKKLGYFGNPGRASINPWNFRDFRRRPNIDTSSLT